MCEKAWIVQGGKGWDWFRIMGTMRLTNSWRELCLIRQHMEYLVSISQHKSFQMFADCEWLVIEVWLCVYQLASSSCWMEIRILVVCCVMTPLHVCCISVNFANVVIVEHILFVSLYESCKSKCLILLMVPPLLIKYINCKLKCSPDVPGFLLCCMMDLDFQKLFLRFLFSLRSWWNKSWNCVTISVSGVASVRIWCVRKR